MLRVSEPLGTTAADADRLEELGQELAGAPTLGLDTEFMRERTYRAQLCLLQIATPTRCVCVDPLGSLPLAPLAPALANPSSVKIMHAARQDLEVLWPLFGTLPRLFDTQVAAGLTGLPAQVGYGELVRQVLGVTLDKAHTRTDWSRRPLSPAQLEYALDDVAHLAALRDALLEKLDRLGRLAWVDEDLAALGRPEDLFVDPERASERLKGVAELDEWRQQLARELAAWRERRAADRNRPRSWILSDTALRAIVLRVPRSPEELGVLEDVTAGFVENSGEEVLGIITALAPPARLPPPAGRARPDPAVTAAVKRLGDVVREVATALELSPELLATRRDLEALVRGATDVAPLQGWRGSVLATRLRAAL
jgi:ribonuclease D